MNAVMLSIHPKWCKLIFDGAKTVEIRKARPIKIEEPFKAFVYCTLPNRRRNTICGCFKLNDDELFVHPRHGLKYGDSIELMAEDDYSKDNFLNGKVIGELTIRKVERFPVMDCDLSTVCADSALHKEEMLEYAGGRENLYAWQIERAELYEKPLPLSAFRVPEALPGKHMKIAPQSWCYVEDIDLRGELEEGAG